MGSLLHSTKIDPNRTSTNRNTNTSLFDIKQQVSRSNFKFLRKIASSGIDEQCVLWLACNIHNCKQTFYIKQYNKFKVYSHKRVQVVLDQMRLLTQSNNPYFIKTYYAFQDYESLYLVCEAIDSITFQNFVKGRNEFSEQQMRYIVLAIVSIFQQLHSKGYAFTEFSPKNLHFNRKTGELKLIEITNPAKIDTYCSSCVVSKVSPYSAPQILLRDKVYAECDFYSLGIIIYEMMIQGPAFPLPRDKQTYQRSAILKENIQVEKSQIPEKWHPDSADFLIKLLIKNPVLRLGRYGSFEVKNHPWLKQTSQEQNLKRGIDLKDWALQQQKGVGIEQKQYVEQNQSSEVIQDYLFQQLFSAFKFKFRKQQVPTINKAQYFSSKTSLLQKQEIEMLSAS